ncbi:MAG: DUF4249 domain-containing protein [Sphingobacteriales bacterium]|jgi:hypothetical protein|nr:DUF4249 domain-containing protein [Sphingobacteriales bacterium]
MNRLLGLLLILWLSACEKNIEFDLEDAPPVLVVDAQIENDKAPVVVLTKSLSYFSEISPEILAASFVRNATVTISNGSLTHQLKEYAIPLIPGYTAYYYSIDSSNLSTAFNGAFNTTYVLSITSEGKSYTATTKIPLLTSVPDSFFFKIAPQNPDTNKRVMLIRASDPPGLGNYARYFTKRNQGALLPGENSVFSDEVIDGTSYEAQLPQGIDRNNPPTEDEQFYLKGDTVTLKFCNIDRNTYLFWNTWEFAYQSIGNPFAQPNKVLGNISNGALGSFCGYAASIRTRIVE